MSKIGNLKGCVIQRMPVDPRKNVVGATEIGIVLLLREALDIIGRQQQFGACSAARFKTLGARRTLSGAQIAAPARAA